MELMDQIMNTSKNLYFEDFESIFASLNENSNDSSNIFLKNLNELKLSNSKYDKLKFSLSILTTLADFEEIYNDKSSLKIFKEATKQILQILIKPMNEAKEKINIQAEILCKWWHNYFSLLNESYLLKKNNEGWGGSFDDWFPKSEFLVLEESLKVVQVQYHWQVNLMRSICLHKFILSHVFESKIFEEKYQIVKTYVESTVIKEFQLAKLCKTQNKKLILRCGFLEELMKIILNQTNEIPKDEEKSHCSKKTQKKREKKREKKNELILKDAILNGRFDKKQFKNLKHSIIIGDDGGFYALLNTIDEEEKEILLEDGEISKEYAKSWDKITGELKNTYKVVIGKGSFGKIRICLVLTKNETSTVMIPGQIICVKKTYHFKKGEDGNLTNEIFLNEIRKNTWNDYSGGEIGDLVFSPAVYDIKIIEPLSSLASIHYKGYTMQEFIPVYDGSKVFRKNAKYFNDWLHQKRYLISIFEATKKLLILGICMTDLKPENTLYDGENLRGMLIDLAGVVKKASIKELQACKVKYIHEITRKYISPELKRALQMNDPEQIINLSKFSSYCLGMFIKNIVLKHSEGKSFHEDLKKLAISMTIDEIDNSEIKRISVSEGLNLLYKIGEDEFKLNVDFPEFIKLLLRECRRNPEMFGLNPNLKEIEKKYIKLMCSQYDPNKYEQLHLEDLQLVLDQFIFSSISISKDYPKVLVLLGSAGSGKSTILQIKYIEALEKWKENDPIPLYINLATETDLCARWRWLNKKIEIENEIPFNSFTGYKYPIILFVDSFDETPNKINYVSKFFGDLKHNEINRCIICCRNEFIQKEDDFTKFFDNKFSKTGYDKRYITPLENTGFDIEKYVKFYYEQEISESGTHLLDKVEDILKSIQDHNLKSLMNTGFMVHLTLEVLPKIIKKKLINEKITRRIIYKKYMKKKILKVGENINNLLTEKFDLFKKGKKLSHFYKETAIVLAKILHNKGTSILLYDSIKDKEIDLFFTTNFYDGNISFYENSVFNAIIRGLDLHFEVRGVIPNQKILLGFSHDTIKNYFLVDAIVEECEKMQNNILGQKLIVEDEFLVKFLVEIVKENNKFKENLLNIIFKSKEGGTNIIIASTNAITIFIAANISFACSDLSGIKINGANLRDGTFSGCNFKNAMIQNSILENCKLDQANLSEANLQGAYLGIYPEINVGCETKSCCISSNGKWIAAGCSDGSIKIWDHKNNNEQIKGFEPPSSAIFSPNDQFILTICSNILLKLWEKSTGNLLKEFKGHTNSIKSIAFSPDGAFIISGSMDRNINLWEVQTGSLLKTINGHFLSVNYVEFSPNGVSFLSCSDDKNIKLWDRKNLLKTFQGHKNSVNCAKFSSNGKFIVSCSNDKTIKIWEILSGNLLKTLNGHTRAIHSVVISPDGSFIFSGSADKTIKIWKYSSGDLINSLDSHEGAVISLDISKDGNFLLSGSEDETIKIWSHYYSGNLNFLQTFEGHTNSIKSVAFSSDSTCFLSGSEDESVKLWDRCTGKQLKVWEGHRGCVKHITFSPKDGRSILSSSLDGTIKLWNSQQGNLQRTFSGHSDSVNSAAFTKDESFILSGSSDQTIKLWNLSTGDIIKTFEGHNNSVLSVVFTPDESGFLSGSNDRSIKLWNILSGKVLKTFEGHAASVNSVTFSLKGEFILSASSDHTIKIWETSYIKSLKTLKGHSNSVNSAIFSSDERLIISGSSDETIKLWERLTGDLLKTFEGHKNSVYSVSSYEENIIMSCSDDKKIKFWDKYNRNILKIYEGHVDSVNSVSFSPQGNYFISGSSDKTIKLWDVLNGYLQRTYEGHTNSVMTVAFYMDGNFFASGSADKTVRIWDVLNTKHYKCLKGHTESILSIRFLPAHLNNEASIISGSSDKTIKIWGFPSGNLLETLEGHTDSVICLANSTSGEFILSGSRDKSIILWNKSSGSLLKIFHGHLSSVRCVAFAPEDKFMISGSSDETMILWEISTGHILSTLEGHTSWINSVTFSNDGKYIFSCSRDQQIKIWNRATGNLLKTLEGHSDSCLSLAISSDGNNIISGSSDKTIKLWKNKSECGYQQNKEKLETINENDENFPYDFICKLTISPAETPLYCKNMILIENSGYFDNKTRKVFIENGAIFGESEIAAKMIISKRDVINNDSEYDEMMAQQIMLLEKTLNVPRKKIAIKAKENKKIFDSGDFYNQKNK